MKKLNNIKSAYIDCNIILDWIIDRQPFSLYATELIDLIEKKKIKGFVSPLILANCFYIVQKVKGKEIANFFLQDSLKLFSIIDNTKTDLKLAIKNAFIDFEDDIHYFSVINNDLNIIITRNKKDFKSEKVNLFTAEEFLLEIKE